MTLSLYEGMELKLRFNTENSIEILYNSVKFCALATSWT